METEEITNFDKSVYNLYLKVVAKYQDRPYKQRKNFEKFKDYHILKKVSDFLHRYLHIDGEMYFSAPYEVWKDEQFYNLEFYTKRKALNCYVNYKKKLLNLPPDDKYHLKKIIDSFYWIKSFCGGHEISVSDYINHKDGIYSFLTHLKNDYVSIYALFAFDSFRGKLKNDVDNELKRMLFSDLFIDYDIMYRKYVHSDRAKKISKKCLQKIS